MEIQLRATAFRKLRPVFVDLGEEGARGLRAIVRLHENCQPTSEIRVLHRNACDVTVGEVFEAVERFRIDPSRTGGRHDDERRSSKPPHALELCPGKPCAGLVRRRGPQPYIDAKGLHRALPGARLQLVGGWARRDELAPLASKFVPFEERGIAADLERGRGPGPLRFYQRVEFLE